MGLLHSVSRPYFRCQGCGAAILEGFATIIRVTPRISHQRWRSPCDKLDNPKSTKIPIQTQNEMLKQENALVRTPTHSMRTLCVLRCENALQRLFQAISGEIRILFSTLLWKFSTNASKTNAKTLKPRDYAQSRNL